VSIIAEQLDRVRGDPVTEEELHRTKEQLKGSTILALESTRRTRIGRSIITGRASHAGDLGEDRCRNGRGREARLAGEQLKRTRPSLRSRSEGSTSSGTSLRKAETTK